MKRQRNVECARGFSLIELMVAMAIGLVLVLGAVFVYSQSRKTYSVNDTTGRMQEKARYVMQLMEPDIELAGYLGYTGSQSALAFGTSSTAEMRQTAPAAGGLPAVANVCGPNFAVDFSMPIQGTNNGYLDTYPTAALQPACAAAGGAAQAGSDTLTIRRVSTDDVPATLNRLQVYVSRLQLSSALLFNNGTAPGAITANMTGVRDLIVRSFYISPNSDIAVGVPALRVKRLNWLPPGTVPAASSFDDEEVMSGVEDLQVQFGIDTGDYNNDGVIDNFASPGFPQTRAIATRYVNPDSALVTSGQAQVVAVRLWLRIRGDQIEPGFVDPGPYNYADVVNWVPNATQRQFRRILVSKTIVIRNARTE
jgi:type IV pilus assembly protein PilW